MEAKNNEHKAVKQLMKLKEDTKALYRAFDKSTPEH
jgi:hypothetical protein